MKVALVVLGALAAILASLSLNQGYDTAYSLAYGTVVTMALSISMTFFWLWRMRATPLALGMGFSWAGTGGVLGWWWLYRFLGTPEVMVDNEFLFLFVSSYIVGGILHFQVIVRSLGWRSLVALLPTGLFLGGALFF